jgi:hypothetical protein
VTPEFRGRRRLLAHFGVSDDLAHVFQRAFAGDSAADDASAVVVDDRVGSVSRLGVRWPDVDQGLGRP